MSSLLTSPHIKRKDGARFYRTEAGILPGVTTILENAYAKPMLVEWAARIEREMVMAAATNLWEDLQRAASKMGRASYFISLQQRLGQQRAHQRALEKAANTGTSAHALIEWTLKHELGVEEGIAPEISPDAAWVFQEWQKWREAVNLKPLAVEGTVSSRYGYAGTFDLHAKMDWLHDNGMSQRIEVIADWKSGRALYPDCKLQNAAYVQAAGEMGIVQYPVAGCIVRLPKRPEDGPLEVKMIPAGEQAELFSVFLSVLDQWKYREREEGKVTPA